MWRAKDRIWTFKEVETGSGFGTRQRLTFFIKTFFLVTTNEILQEKRKVKCSLEGV